jgi:hypothetical protein
LYSLTGCTASTRALAGLAGGKPQLAGELRERFAGCRHDLRAAEAFEGPTRDVRLASAREGLGDARLLLRRREVDREPVRRDEARDRPAGRALL